jgi:predicted Zn-dependent protease
MPVINLIISHLSLRRKIQIHRLLIFMISFMVLSGCATNPVTGRREFMLVSENREFEIGQGVDKQVREELGVYIELSELRSKLKEVVENIGKNSDRPDIIYRAEIVDTPDFNAFAVPGGFVYVHRGLLERMNSVDELASVMAHEIAHVAARHSASQISKAQLLNIGMLGAVIATGGEIQAYGDLINLGSILAFSKFSRDDEREADYHGLKYMTRAGYNPEASISVMKQIQGLQDREPGSLEIWFMTHPPTAERIDLLNDEIDELSYDDPGVIKRKIRRNEFIALLDGMAVGEWNGKELVRDDRYYNKEFPLSIPIPSGWQVLINSNYYTAVFADTKNQSSAFFDIQPLRKQKSSELYVNELSSILEKKGLRRITDTDSSGNYSHGALSVSFRGTSSNVGAIYAKLIAFTRGESGYSILGMFDGMINGMVFLSPEDALKIKPPRMTVHRVSRDESWDTITLQYFKETKEKEKLAEYNGMSAADTLTPGTLLKIPPSTRFR